MIAMKNNHCLHKLWRSAFKRHRSSGAPVICNAVILTRNFMKKLVALILLLSFTFSACSHVIPKYQNESAQDFYNRINNLCKDKVVSLKLNNEQAFDCKEIKVSADSTSYLDVNSSSLKTIKTNKIISISFSEGERGAWEGLLYGTFIGGAAGLIPNLVLPKGTGHPSGNPLIILYGALAGAVIGVIYGSYNESKTTIVLGN
jgi:hypothetical protein